DGSDVGRADHVVARLIARSADHDRVSESQRLAPALARIDRRMVVRIRRRSRHRDHPSVEGLQFTDKLASDRAPAKHAYCRILERTHLGVGLVSRIKMRTLMRLAFRQLPQ